MAFANTLRHRISIQHRTTARDEAGQPIEVWSEFTPAYADIRVMGGLETIKAGAQTSKANASIRIRYREDVDASMRVLHGATVYQVVSVLPDLARRVYTDLVCEVIK